jgi:hypothetical protein
MIINRAYHIALAAVAVGCIGVTGALVWQQAATTSPIDAACPSAMAIADTPENRAAEADDYLKQSLPSLFEDAIEAIAATLPGGERALFKAMASRPLDMDQLRQAMRAVLVRHFTPDELKAQAVFHRSPLGMSVMSKFGAFSADMMPSMTAAIMRAAMLTLTASNGGGSLMHEIEWASSTSKPY